MFSFSNCILVLLGGGVGSLSRYLVSVWAFGRFGNHFPYGTLIVNILGCLAIGFVLTLSLEKLIVTENIRLLLVTGFLGGFTTFSAFGFETLHLMRTGNTMLALVYIGASIIAGLAAVWIGVHVAKLF